MRVPVFLAPRAVRSRCPLLAGANAWRELHHATHCMSGCPQARCCVPQSMVTQNRTWQVNTHTHLGDPGQTVAIRHVAGSAAGCSPWGDAACALSAARQRTHPSTQQHRPGGSRPPREDHWSISRSSSIFIFFICFFTHPRQKKLYDISFTEPEGSAGAGATLSLRPWRGPRQGVGCLAWALLVTSRLLACLPFGGSLLSAWCGWLVV